FRMDYSADVINAGLALRNSKIRTLDTTKIAYMGRSMGGGIGFNVAVATSAQGVFSSFVFFAPTSANYVENFNKWGRGNPDRANPIVKFVGLPEENPDFWASVSPKNYWSQVSAPMMIHHGDKDESCPVRWARRPTPTSRGRTSRARRRRSSRTPRPRRRECPGLRGCPRSRRPRWNWGA
ncbi:MAG: hypothetical protein EBY80_16420, partial [Actinobacteria bacterium]|nr:hypothetical protein [Actinomycetota bacterium]